MTILETYNKYNNFGRLLDMDYQIISPGNISYSFKVLEEHLATKTAAHGGVLAAYMDAIIGVASLSAVANDKKVVATIEFKINYLKPAFLNDLLIGKGKVIQKGNRIIITEGKIYNQNKELICTAIGTLNAYPFVKSDMV